MCSICVPFAFQLRSNCVPFAFHLRFTFTGTHLWNAFRFIHSYRNRTLSEFEGILMTLKQYCLKLWKLLSKGIHSSVLNRLLNFISKRGSQNITIFGLQPGLHYQSFCDHRRSFKWIN
jgi:hypothetical protein